MKQTKNQIFKNTFSRKEKKINENERRKEVWTQNRENVCGTDAFVYCLDDINQTL